MEGMVPLWLKIAYGVFVPFLIVVYWPRYGPSNFLWLSDIALFMIAGAVIFEMPLLASMPAVGVLPLEIFWTIDFLLLGRFRADELHVRQAISALAARRFAVSPGAAADADLDAVEVRL
jgi:hypothetical protein